ncbi:MAG: antitoxin [Propionibacterium sp.]|nr:antitoxin [Propionibacterium sp.]
MQTLYIRNVPEETVDVLKRRAADEGVSLTTYVASELTKLAHRPTNAEVVDRLKRHDRAEGPGTTTILEAVADGRR